MPSTLRDELQQGKPFVSLQQEAYLNVVRTGALLVDAFEQMLKPHGISSAQYNVLRILRGAEPQGLCRNDLRDRLLTRMPDVTRLLDRMEDAGLVIRTREAADRRLVTTRPTKRALHLLDELDTAVTEEHERRLGHLGKKQLRQLIDLLTLTRQP